MKRLQSFFVSGLMVSLITWGFGGAVRTVAAQDQIESAAPAAVFSNTAPITIPAGPAVANPYPSSITVSGLTGNIPNTPGSVKVTLNGFSHSFASDLGIVLVGPTGDALVLQSGAGAGAISNINYTFSDTGTAQLPETTVWGPGTYKPTAYFGDDNYPAPGPGTNYGNPGPDLGGTATFASEFGGTNPNGTWNLFVVDFVSGDAGSIAGGWSLEIETGGGPAPRDAVVDFNGDGRTDWAVVRPTGNDLQWFIAINGGAPLAPRQWGVLTDTVLAGDFDGDGRDDITVWRPGAQAQFYILQSQTSTFRIDNFGQTGDDPAVIGDYNNDGRDDVAVYREGATAGAPSTWFYRTAPNALFVSRQFGQNGDDPAPGDYDGDGSNDFVVQRAVGAVSVFYLGLTTNVFTAIEFGGANDSVVPGDYDGDGKTDIATVSFAGTNILWRYEPSSVAGVTVVSDTWGVSATDVTVQGDYNGDGRTDYAVWRPSNGTFFVLTPETRNIFTQVWGVSTDAPVANYNTH